MLRNVKRLFKIAAVKRKNKNVKFLRGANIAVGSTFDGYNVIGQNSWVDGHLGYGTYVGDECVFKAKTGKYCSIGHHVNILTGTHPSHVFVSTSPVFYSTRKQNGLTYVSESKFKEVLLADEENGYGVILGNDVWVGFGVTLLGGITIGDGAIIASNAFVNKDVPPYTIVGGTPAKVIGKRFDDDQIEWLESFAWWDKDEDWIRENADKFVDISKLRPSSSE